MISATTLKIDLGSDKEGFIVAHEVFSYRQIQSLFAVIDEHMDKAVGTPQASHCFYLKISNHVSSAILLLYLLDRKLSFFAGTPDGAFMPEFCSHVITPVEDSYTEPGIESNIGADSDNRHMQPNLAFFRSSGTTGRPKFICYHQDSLLQNAQGVCQRFGLSHTDRVLVPVPIHHMFGFGVGLLPALLSGASVQLLAHTNVVKLFDQLKTFQPSFALITPSLIKMLNMLGKKNHYPSRFVSAGDTLFKEVYDAFARNYGKLYNLYGCTELGAIAISEDDPTEDIVPVTALEGVHMRVVENEKGEVLVNHPFGFEYYTDEYGRAKDNNSVGGWYRTSDMGKLVSPNALSVLGRVDSCVNRYGFLVASKEIESELHKLLPDVEQLLVMVMDEQGVAGNKVVAFLEAGGVVQQVKKSIKQTLPPKYQPDDCVILDKIPTLPNGKPDKILLKKNYYSLN